MEPIVDCHTGEVKLMKRLAQAAGGLPDGGGLRRRDASPGGSSSKFPKRFAGPGIRWRLQTWLSFLEPMAALVVFVRGGRNFGCARKSLCL